MRKPAPCKFREHFRRWWIAWTCPYIYGILQEWLEYMSTDGIYRELYPFYYFKPYIEK